MGKTQTETLPPIRQRLGLRFSRKDRAFEVKKLFIIWLFALLLQAHNRPIGIAGGRVI